MSFSYYQDAQPGWGTNQYRFGPPPTPSFQPQPSWGGYDFYRAHAHSPDLSLYEQAWGRVRDYNNHDEATSLGVGMHEAREWHRRAYGGAGELSRMQPSSIGHAAAYEAYRTWLHNRSIYEPLSGDDHRQREGLVGLAIAEASRLLPFARREGDHHSRRAVAEAAAATASALYFESRDGLHRRREPDDHHRGRSQSRWGSSSSYGSSYEDPYAYDDELRDYQRGRSRSRYGGRSRSRGVPIVGHAHSHSGSYHSGSYPGGYASSLPVGASLSQSGQPYGSYAPSGGMGMVPGQQYPQSGMAMQMAGSGYGGLQSGGVPLSASSYGSFGQSPTMPGMPGYAPFVGNTMMGGGMLPGMQQQPLIIEKPRSSHSHKHRHRSRSHRHRSHSRSSRHHRSRSVEPRGVEPYVDHYPAGYHY